MEKARACDFAWGSNDCVTFSSGWVGLMTGTNPAERFAGKYDTERGAFEIMIRHGVKSMEGAGWFLFGTPKEPIAFVDRGDIVFARGALGICLGSTAAFLMADGLAFLKREEFEKFWEV